MGDFDRDGDDDLVGLRLFRNGRREVAARHAGAIGKSFDIALTSTVTGSSFTLLLSAGQVDVPVGPLGVLGVDPALFFAVVASGTIPPDGAAVTLSVPASPSLPGITVHWQAVIGPPAHLTRVVSTTITDL